MRMTNYEGDYESNWYSSETLGDQDISKVLISKIQPSSIGHAKNILEQIAEAAEAPDFIYAHPVQIVKVEDTLVSINDHKLLYMFNREGNIEVPSQVYDLRELDDVVYLAERFRKKVLTGMIDSMSRTTDSPERAAQIISMVMKEDRATKGNFNEYLTQESMEQFGEHMRFAQRNGVTHIKQLNDISIEKYDLLLRFQNHYED